jgi:CRP/FNR family transcriptional regulator
VSEFLSPSEQELVTEHPIFKYAVPESRQALLERAEQRAYREGELIFEREEPYAGFFVVLSGTVKIFRCAPNGRCLVLHIARPGESLGDSPLVGHNQPLRYHASAETLDATRVLFFAESLVRDMMNRYPEMCKAMLTSVSNGLIMMLDRFELVSLYNVKGRLAWYLLKLDDHASDPPRFSLDVPKSVLAELLGTIPETLSRALKDLRKAGCISISGRLVRILDRDRLIDYAEGRND